MPGVLYSSSPTAAPFASVGVCILLLFDGRVLLPVGFGADALHPFLPPRRVAWILKGCLGDETRPTYRAVSWRACGSACLVECSQMLQAECDPTHPLHRLYPHKWSGWRDWLPSMPEQESPRDEIAGEVYPVETRAQHGGPPLEIPQWKVRYPKQGEPSGL